MSQQITVDNKSSVVSNREFFNACWAVNYQLIKHISKSPWNISAHLTPLYHGQKPPVGAWHMILMDHSSERGTLGFHDDEEGNDIPYTDVFCVDAKEFGKSISSVMSHESLEMLINPDVSNPKTVTHNNKIYIQEICDAVEGNDYDIGVLEGIITGLTVSDFVFPAWFGIHQSINNQMSFRNSVYNAFELSSEGYISTAPISEPTNWQAEFGEKIDKLPSWASRLPRIHHRPQPRPAPIQPRPVPMPGPSGMSARS